MADRHPAPGPWLRLTSLAAAAGTAVVVATGEWSRSHEAAVLATLALTICVAVSVWFGHRDRPLLADDLPLVGDEVTIEQLLAHRSGIGDLGPGIWGIRDLGSGIWDLRDQGRGIRASGLHTGVHLC